MAPEIKVSTLFSLVNIKLYYYVTPTSLKFSHEPSTYGFGSSSFLLKMTLAKAGLQKNIENPPIK